jgi:hypothetical protein
VAGNRPNFDVIFFLKSQVFSGFVFLGTAIPASLKKIDYSNIRPSSSRVRVE